MLKVEADMTRNIAKILELKNSKVTPLSLSEDLQLKNERLP